MMPGSDDGNAQACAFMEIAGSGNGDFYGVGIDGNIVTASIKALVSGINRMGVTRLAQRVEQAACSMDCTCLAMPMRLIPLTSALIDAVTMLPSMPTP